MQIRRYKGINSDLQIKSIFSFFKAFDTSMNFDMSFLETPAPRDSGKTDREKITIFFPYSKLLNRVL